MIANPKEMSLKERCEAQIISELVASPTLAALFPKRQNSDSKPKMPRIAVSVTIGREVSPQSGIFNATGVAEFYFDASRGQTGEQLDLVVDQAGIRLGLAQGRGEYGLILDGEQPMQFVSETIRKRVIAFRLIAS